jgi:ferredoxin-NADP reductase
MVTPGNGPIIMIAGGIGITPMLTDLDDQRRILLIWSNRTREYIVFPEEFENFKRDLQHLKIIHVFTRNPRDGGEKGRLNKTKLERLLERYSRKSEVFICGPFEMMKEINRAIKKIGFSSSRVYKEEFKL